MGRRRHLRRDPRGRPGDGVRHAGPLPSELVEIHASGRATRFEALEPILQGVRSRLGGFREGAAAGLAIRHDQGSQYMSRDFQNEIAFLGPESSPPSSAPRKCGRCSAGRSVGCGRTWRHATPRSRCSGRSAPSVPGRRAHGLGRSTKAPQIPSRPSPHGCAPGLRDATTVVGPETPPRPFPPPRNLSPRSVHFLRPIDSNSPTVNYLQSRTVEV